MNGKETKVVAEKKETTRNSHEDDAESGER